MSTEKSDEETYSLIFTSLKHPIRRKILRMLRNDELTFSQILEAVAIDSGHLSYHLENLGDLITRSSEGKYSLSSLGRAAARLMGGVEEYNPPNASRATNKVDMAVRVFSVVLAAILLWSSLYTLAFMTETTSPFVRVPKTDERIPFALAPNQTYEYNITIIYGDKGLVSTELNELRIVTNKPSSAIDHWKEYFLRLELELNGTGDISITVRDPASNIISYGQLGGYGAMNIGPDVHFTQNGSYQVEIKNLQTNLTRASVAFEIMFDEFQRPLFYYGVAGIVTVVLFPVIVLSSRFWTKKTQKAKQT
jgi:DNA-binding transcriptional ArsR family regulator